MPTPGRPGKAPGVWGTELGAGGQEAGDGFTALGELGLARLLSESVPCDTSGCTSSPSCGSRGADVFPESQQLPVRVWSLRTLEMRLLSHRSVPSMRLSCGGVGEPEGHHRRAPCPQVRCRCRQGPPHGPPGPRVQRRKVTGGRVTPTSPTTHRGQDGGRKEVVMFSSQGQRVTRPDKPPRRLRPERPRLSDGKTNRGKCHSRAGQHPAPLPPRSAPAPASPPRGTQPDSTGLSP